MLLLKHFLKNSLTNSASFLELHSEESLKKSNHSYLGSSHYSIFSYNSATEKRGTLRYILKRPLNNHQSINYYQN